MRVLPIVVLLLGLLFLYFRWTEVSKWYANAAIKGVEAAAKCELERAKQIEEYLKKQGHVPEAELVGKAVRDFEKTVGEFQNRIEPYIQDSDFDSAIRMIDSAVELSDNTKRFLRGRTYDRWGWIVVSSNLPGGFEMYAVRPDASEAFRLTNNDYEELWPDVASDGYRIAYSRLRNDVDRSIAVLDLRNGSEKWLPLSGETNLDPCFSPNGYFLAYAGLVANYAYVYQYNFHTEEVLRLARGMVCNQPKYSPDGAQVVFEGLPVSEDPLPIQIMIMKADGTDLKPLTHFSSGHSREPRIAPNNVNFCFRRDGDIYEGDLNTGEIKVISDPQIEEKSPYFSPNSRHIIFTAYIDGKEILVRQDRLTGKRFFFPPIGTCCQYPQWVGRLSVPPNAERIVPGAK